MRLQTFLSSSLPSIAILRDSNLAGHIYLCLKRPLWWLNGRINKKRSEVEGDLRESNPRRTHTADGYKFLRAVSASLRSECIYINKVKLSTVIPTAVQTLMTGFPERYAMRGSKVPGAPADLPTLFSLLDKLQGKSHQDKFHGILRESNPRAHTNMEDFHTTVGTRGLEGFEPPPGTCIGFEVRSVRRVPGGFLRNVNGVTKSPNTYYQNKTGLEGIEHPPGTNTRIMHIWEMPVARTEWKYKEAKIGEVSRELNPRRARTSACVIIVYRRCPARKTSQSKEGRGLGEIKPSPETD
ncbi:hypothetical protein FB451DRAFT_1177902 [Mycena latifolia]|nr:hypothetical protein FB451DRAFT_1177902 [Mycena latifolia]